MALDRQRILSELGSVMNQLKSADCGCMGKLFGDSGQNVEPMQNSYQSHGVCRRGGCCGHGYGWNQNNSGGENFGNGPCMGMRCNPKMLFADTYGYLNQSLMQPTVREVYEDLKSISPTNTVMNNPMAKQMGLSNEMTGQGGMQAVPDQFQGNPNVSGNTESRTNSGQMGQFGGMGPQIMNMLGGNILKQHNAPQNQAAPQNNQLLEPMMIDAPQSLHGKVGVTPLSIPNSVQGQAFYSNQPNIHSDNVQNQMSGNQNFNPAQAQGQQHEYGKHTQGMAKFNEMFPGVMKNDLGFDPMAIAIQMNPANQKQAAIDSMYKMLNNTGMNRIMDNKPPQSQNLTASDQVTAQGNRPQDVEALNYQASAPVPQEGNIDNSGQLQAQNIASNQQIDPNNRVDRSTFGQANQHMYTALTSSPNANQQQPIQYQQQPQAQQPIYDPNTGSLIAPPTFPTVYEGYSQAGGDIQPANESTYVPNTQQMIKEPIFPADITPYMSIRQKNYEYNTLGQPINRQSAKPYHTPEPPLPQTLSPQPAVKQRNDFSKYSNVKSTMSKTSLFGNRPVSRAASRNQLQQIYNTYKGSHSFTQQNINNQAKQGVTNSDGRLQAVQQISPTHQQIPVEKVGGDTVANNLQEQRTQKVEEVIGQIGDVPNANKPMDPASLQVSAPMRKGRNGLQDMVYTSYPISAAWTFHGDNRAATAGYHRYR